MKYLLSALLLCGLTGCSSATIPINDYTVAHAGGGISNYTYSNSQEALEKNRDSYQIFEIDFMLTSDNSIVCIHDWEGSAQSQLGKNFSKQPPSLSEFLFLSKQHGEFTNCTLTWILRWLDDNPTKFIVTDTKGDNLAFLTLLSSHDRYINRFIPQIYSPDQYQVVSDLGFERIIWTTYTAPFSVGEIVSPVQAGSMKLFAITAPKERFPDYLQIHESLDVPLLAHTVNDITQKLALINDGVTAVYTDYLHN